MTKVVMAVAAVVGSFLLGWWTRPGSPQKVTPEAAASEANTSVVNQEPAERPVITYIDTSARRSTPVLSGPARIDAMELQAMGVSPEEMFDAQGRDEAWAPVIEDFYRREYTPFLRAALGEFSDLRFTCKESVCEIAFEVVAADKDRAYRRQQYMPTGSLWKPFSRTAERDGFVTIGMLITLGDEVRDPADLARFYDHYRNERFPPGRNIADIIAEWERMDGL